MTQSPTILIVDDDEGHAILIRENLEAAGLSNRIRHFRDGQAILDFLFKSSPPISETFLVLLDIRMPKVDGIEVLRRIKAHPDLRRLPVIMLTTNDDSRDVVRCHELGCNVYMQKPVDYDRFSEAIRRLGKFVPLLHVPQLSPG
ncbi:MAG: response regulator [Verrucomicrobia bacterium]|jgi:CheY-like chemotaxis protein|nr:response regulator [Verrucomicrobiota bacterium]